MKRTDLIVCLLITLFGLFTLKDLFKPFFYTSHDGQNQIVRLYYFDQALRDGQFPPRIAGGLLNGYSYPLFVFSYHMPWIIAEPFYYVTHDILASVKYAFIVGYILSGFSMYWFLKRVFGRYSAVIGTVIYLYTPYRFVNIFVRAAMGDATSFIFLPLIFLSLYETNKSIKDKKNIQMYWKWICLGALAVAGLVLSHAMIFVLTMIFFGLYYLWLMIFSKYKLKFSFSFFLINIFGLGLSAYYFIPSFIERNYTKFSDIMGGVFVGNTFVDIRSLLYSPWGYGMIRAEEGGMSVQVGLVEWFVFTLCVVFFSFYLFRKKPGVEIKYSFFFLLSFTLTILMMLPISLGFWKLLSNIVVIDFTWRVLVVTVFVSAVLAAFISTNTKLKPVLGIVLVIASLYVNRNHLRINKIQDWDLPFYLKLERTTNQYDEYTPKWVDSGLVRQKAKSKILFSETQETITPKIDKSNELDFSINATESGIVQVNTVYYPGWKVYINGVEKPIDYKQGLGGVMTFAINGGVNDIKMSFRETPLRVASDSLSLISGIIMIGGVFFYHKKANLKK